MVDASNSSGTARTISVFLAYSHQDEELLDQLHEHLAPLRRQNKISVWHDRKIEAGEEWGRAIDEQLKTCDVILIMVSSSFINSDYCYNKELAAAIDRHNSGEARVIPVILRHCDWKELPFGNIQALPRDGRPVTIWNDRDDAWLNVAQGIRRVVDSISQTGASQAIDLTLDLEGSSEEGPQSDLANLATAIGDLANLSKVRWALEHATDKYRIEDAQQILMSADDGLEAIRLADFVRARPLLHKSIDSVRTDLKRLARERPLMNDFRIKEFWWHGDEALERLEATHQMLESMGEAGIDPKDGPAVSTLRNEKACIRLFQDSEHRIETGFRNTHLLVKLPVRNEGKGRARDVKLLSVASELDGNPAHPENGLLDLEAEANGWLSFIYLPTYLDGAAQANESRFRLRIGFRDGLGNDEVGYVIEVRDVGNRTFRGDLAPERTVASPFCPRLAFDLRSNETPI